MCIKPKQPSIPLSSRPFFTTLAILILATILYLPRLSHGALRHWDEAWYAEASREMLTSSSWFTVLWNGAPWFHKPPLTLWATAGFFFLLGESEASARLFSFLCSLGVLWLISRFPAVDDSNGGPFVGILAALILLGLPEFAAYSTRGQMDVPLTLGITTQLYGFWRGRNDERWHWLSGLAFGVGLMTKGAAACLGLLIPVAYILLSRDWRPLRSRSWWLAPLFGLALAAPWHIHQIVVHGQPFAEEYFTRHFGQILTDSTRALDSPAASVIYYWKFLVERNIPWGWGIVLALVWGAIEAIGKREPLLIFAWSWTAVVPLALSLAYAKWSWYLVPMYPGAALLASLLISRTTLYRRAPRAFIAVAVIAAFATMGVAFLVPVNTDNEREIRDLKPVIDRYVYPSVPVHTLQTEFSRLSVYPIATAFYSERPVHAVGSIDHLLAITANASNPFYTIAHEEVVPTLLEKGKHSDGPNFQAEVLGRSGPILLLRIHPDLGG